MKIKSFIEIVQETFNLDDYKTIYDICSGKGYLAEKLQAKERNVIAIDIREPKVRINYVIKDIWEDFNLQKRSLVLAIHACGTLTDRVIELAIDSQSDFAVMSCCHNDKVYFSPMTWPDNRIALMQGRDVFVDHVRMYHARESGYESGIETIDPNITKKNRIIWGRYIRKNPGEKPNQKISTLSSTDLQE